MKVLLVDDDKIDREMVKRALLKADLTVQINEAVTVDEGLELCTLNSYDVVLLDYQLPQRNGTEMIVELREGRNDNNATIVMMSSSEDEELSLVCIRAGAQDFLLKSEISAARLKRAILHASTRFELEKKLYVTYQKVKMLAETDSLTGLSNRYFFDESLKQVLLINQRCEQRLGLLLFDIDNFKLVNDTFGHNVGDLLLKKIVSRVKGCLRGNEVFARVGGDEFAIMLSNLKSSEQAGQVARRIVSVMFKPFEIADTSIHTTLSVGISLFPENGRSSSTLLKYADIAMYRAKKQGRNQICFFEEEMQNKFHKRIKTEAELRVAIKEKQFALYYQPVMNPETNKIQGFEALIRWPIGNEVRTPDRFIEIAEDTRQIIPIGFWVMEEAISRLSVWNKKYHCQMTMAINVSAYQLADITLVQHLSDCLEKYNVPAKLIDIELTETALFSDTKEVNQVILGLSKLNCRLSLDDFGTGYSSISHLQNYPISVVKIDRSLMPKNEDDIKNITLLESMVAMVSILGLDLVAEGIETEYQLFLCKKLKIQYIQGYYYDAPLPQNDIENKYLNALLESPI